MSSASDEPYAPYACETCEREQIVSIRVYSGEVVVSRKKMGDGRWQEPWISLPRPQVRVSDWPEIERAVQRALAVFAEKFPEEAE